jgi:hypothetical protein
MCTLLPSNFTIACGKQVLFMFLLEILTGDKGPKPGSFWCAHKKHSQASCKVHSTSKQATSQPVPPSSMPSPRPAMSLGPPAPATSQSRPPSPVVMLTLTLEDMVMHASAASLPTVSPLPQPQIVSNSSFSHMYSWEDCPKLD